MKRVEAVNGEGLYWEEHRRVKEGNGKFGTFIYTYWICYDGEDENELAGEVRRLVGGGDFPRYETLLGVSSWEEGRDFKSLSEAKDYVEIAYLLGNSKNVKVI